MSKEKNEAKDGYYYCEKCDSIPLIHIMPIKDDLKIFSHCKCTKNLYPFDTFNKLYFHQNKKENLSEIKPISEENKINIEQKLLEYNKLKEEINNFNIELKNNLIEYHTKKIKEIERQYENNKTINDNLELIMNRLISNYSSNEKHSSNINNILYNINMDKYYKKKLSSYKKDDLNDMQFISYEREAKNYFSNKHIISPDINEFKTIKYLSDHDDCVNCFLELKNNIGISCSRDSYIIYHDLSQMKSILKFEGHKGGVNYMINTPQNKLISCGGDSSIKIWKEINVEEYINNNDKNNKNENIKPIFEIKTDEPLKKLILYDNNKILTCSHKGIYIYEYDMDNTKLNLLKSVKKEKINDIILFQNSKNIFIIGYTSDKGIFIMDINELKIIKEIKCETVFWTNLLLQFNEDEIIIGNNKNLHIINIDTGIIKLSKATDGYINYLFKLSDGSIIRGERDGIRRYSKYTLDELPPLIEPYDDYDDDHKEEVLSYVCELQDGKIILCYRDSKIKIGYLKTG